MTNNFVVGANPITSEEHKAIRQWLKDDPSFAWWNWINGFWILMDYDNTWTAAEIRDKFMDLTKDATIMVIAIESINAWAGYGPATKDSNMFPWIEERLDGWH